MRDERNKIKDMHFLLDTNKYYNKRVNINPDISLSPEKPAARR